MSADIEAFLRQAAARRAERRAQQQPRRSVVDVEILAEAARRAESSPSSSDVYDPMSSDDIADHADALSRDAERMAQATGERTARMDREIQSHFDRERREPSAGRKKSDRSRRGSNASPPSRAMASSSGSESESAEHRAARGADDVVAIMRMLQSASTFRQAFLVSEVLQRPDFSRFDRLFAPPAAPPMAQDDGPGAPADAGDDSNRSGDRS